MKNKYIKSLGGEEEEVLGSKGRIVSTEETAKDEWQTTLRPQRLDDYIGQEAFKKNLKVYIEAAKSRKEPLKQMMSCPHDAKAKSSFSQMPDVSELITGLLPNSIEYIMLPS